MKTNRNFWTILLAAMVALSLGTFALAEGTDPAAESAAPAVSAEEAPAASVTAEEAQAAADALNEALTAYQNARLESRREAVLDALKQELDGYVAAGKLTQDQANLILQYYTEQLTLSRAGSRGKDGMGGYGGMQLDPGARQQSGFGKGGRGGRGGRSRMVPGGAVPDASAPQAAPGQSVPDASAPQAPLSGMPSAEQSMNNL